jgi:cell division protein FtsW (lipid II flippase)
VVALLLLGTGALLSLSPAALRGKPADWACLSGAGILLVTGWVVARIYQWFHHLPEPGLVPRLTLLLGVGYLLQRALPVSRVYEGVRVTTAATWDVYAVALLSLVIIWLIFPAAGALSQRRFRNPLWNWATPLALAAAVWLYQMGSALVVYFGSHQWPSSRTLLRVRPFGVGVLEFNAPLAILHLVVLGLSLLLAARHQRLAEASRSMFVARLTVGLPNFLSRWLRSLCPPPGRYLLWPLAMIAGTWVCFLTLKENGTALCLALTALLLITVISRRWAVALAFAAVGFLALCTPSALRLVLPDDATPLWRAIIFQNPWHLPATTSVTATENLLTLPRAIQLQAMAGVTGLSTALGPLNDHYRWVPALNQDAPMVGVTLMFGLLGTIAVVLVFLQLLLALIAAARDIAHPRPSLVLLGQTACFSTLAVIGWAGYLKLLPIVGVPWPGYSASNQEIAALVIVVGYAGSMLSRYADVPAPPEAVKPIRSYAGRLANLIFLALLAPLLMLGWYVLPQGSRSVLERQITADRPQGYKGGWDSVRDSPYLNLLRLEVLRSYRVVDRSQRLLLDWDQSGEPSYCQAYLWPISGMADLLNRRYRDVSGGLLESGRDLMCEQEEDPGLDRAWQARTRYAPWRRPPDPQLVMLTLDEQVQAETARRLTRVVRTYGVPGRTRGVAVVWEVPSGEILGMSYSPRPVFTTNRPTEDARAAAASTLKGRAPYDDVWRDRLRETARPGSSFKIVTTTAYLLWRREQDRPLRWWEQERLIGALARSERPFFQGLGHEIGGDLLYHTAVGTEGGFGLSVPPNTTPEQYRRLFHNTRTVRGLDFTSIGMGAAVESALDQMKVITCVSNHGRYVKPHYLRAVISGRRSLPIPPSTRIGPGDGGEERIPREVADQMATVIESAVERPYATTHRAFASLLDQGVKVGAKTGTGDSIFAYANAASRDRRPVVRVSDALGRQGNTVWTVAYGRRNGRIVGVVAMLEDVPSGRMASQVAAPLAAELMEQGLKALGG